MFQLQLLMALQDRTDHPTRRKASTYNFASRSKILMKFIGTYLLVCCPALFNNFTYFPVVFTLVLAKQPCCFRISWWIGVWITQKWLQVQNEKMCQSQNKIKAYEFWTYVTECYVKWEFESITSSMYLRDK